MRFARLNTALGGKSKARKRAGSPDSNDKNGSGGKKKAPKEGLEVGKPRTEEDEEDLGVMKVEEGAEIKKEEVSDEAMEHAVSPSFMESPPDLAQQGVPMDSVFPSPQVGGLPLDYAYTQAFAASQQPMPPMPYYQPQLPFGYPRGSVDFQQPSAGYEYPPMDEEWQMDAK